MAWIEFIGQMMKLKKETSWISVTSKLPGIQHTFRKSVIISWNKDKHHECMSIKQTFEGLTFKRKQAGWSEYCRYFTFAGLCRIL